MSALALPRRRKMGLALLALVIAVFIIVRFYLNGWLLDYVNRVLNEIPNYQGSVEDIDVNLYRGAYRIYGLKLYKRGHTKTPFLTIETTDFSIQWWALLHGRIVSEADLVRPVINFTKQQTGLETDWVKPIQDLMPIDINRVTFTQGKLSYLDYTATPDVNIYINNMSGEARNLRNVEDKTQSLPSSLEVRGDSIGGGKLNIKGKLNILRPVPDIDMDARLEHVNLPALSNYTKAYAGVDIEQGKLSVYTEVKVKDNRVSGYVKPIATGISMIDLRADKNPIEAAWEMFVAAVVQVFTNQSKDQFATKIPLEGRLDNIETDSWTALIGIVRNAFVEALKRGFDSGEET